MLLRCLCSKHSSRSGPVSLRRSLRRVLQDVFKILVLHSGARHQAEEVAIPVATVFDDAPLGRIIHVDYPEALFIALAPLEVIEKRPEEVTAHGHSLLESVGNGFDVSYQVLLPQRVFYLVAAVPLVVIGSSILGD